MEAFINQEKTKVKTVKIDKTPHLSSHPFLTFLQSSWRPLKSFRYKQPFLFSSYLNFDTLLLHVVNENAYKNFRILLPPPKKNSVLLVDIYPMLIECLLTSV